MSINGNGHDDEQTDRDLGNRHKNFPKLLEDNPTNEEMVKAINGLAVEFQLNREALQELGKAVGALESFVRANEGKRRR